MRKVFCLALALALCLSLTLPVYADIWVPPEEEAEMLGRELLDFLAQPLLWAALLALAAIVAFVVIMIIRSKRKK